MRRNKLRELLRAGKPSIGTRVSPVYPTWVEVIGYTGVIDYVEFLAEYNPYDLHDLENFCRAAELSDMSAIIKIDQEHRGFVAQRAVGSGFHGVLFVDSRSADDVRQCVRLVRPETPEDGGLFGSTPRRFALMGQAGSKEYVQALRDIVVMIMIEKRQVLDQLEEILSVPGVDMIQWGPSDYSMSIGKGHDRKAPEVQAAERKVFETALRMGVQPRAEIMSVDDAKRFLDMGVRHFSLGTDLYVLFSWLKGNGEALRKALEGA